MRAVLEGAASGGAGGVRRGGGDAGGGVAVGLQRVVGSTREARAA
jgi:hypothetical protein